MTDTCDKCLFWHPVYATPPNARGHCRYNPPTVLSADGFRDSAWPVTNHNNWCGKFVDKADLAHYYSRRQL